jgi:NTP pyrophosphatase (non-canonical NTP hydrolase)
MNNELELLGLLQEECAEVIQIISKVRRFGFDSKNPYDPSGKDNRTLATDEIGDVYAIMSLLLNMGTFQTDEIHARVDWKLQKLDQHWGYKMISAPEPEPEDEANLIIDSLQELLGYLNAMTRQGEDRIWRPAHAAIPHVEKAIHFLQTPEPKPFKEAIAEAADAGVFDMDDFLTRHRKLENLCCDIRAAAEGDEIEGSHERKYLLRQAADILQQLERLPEENDDED